MKGKGRTADRPQYKMLIKTSSGALQTERAFFTRNSRCEAVTSATKAEMKVKLARERPRIVRYWKCQP